MTLLHEACFLEDEDASLDIAQQVLPTPPPLQQPPSRTTAPPVLLRTLRVPSLLSPIPSPRLATQLVSNGVSADAPSKRFNLPFTALDVACCMGKESVCEMLLDSAPGLWKGSLDLITSQGSAIAEYVQDQEKHQRCVRLLKRRKVLAGLKSNLYKSVEQGDENEVRALLEQVSISDERDSGDLTQLTALAIKNTNYQVLSLLQRFGKVNTPAHLQHALLQIGRVLQSKEDSTNTETTLPRAFMLLFSQAVSLVDAGVVLREPKSRNDQTHCLCLEDFLSELCACHRWHIPAVVHLLLKARVDPNAARVGTRTPLLRACLHGRTETVKLLLDANASADPPAINIEFGPDRHTINTTPLVATILQGDHGGDSASATELVLDALRWRVSKTGLAALVSMAPVVKKLEMVHPPIRTQFSPHAHALHVMCVTCPCTCLTQANASKYVMCFKLLRKLEVKQQSPELSKALVLMAEPPELPEEPEQPAPETPQALVTTVSDAVYNERLQTIMQHLTSQVAVYGDDAERVEEIAQIKRQLASGKKRPETLGTLLRWSCLTCDDDTLTRMVLEAGADPNLCAGYGPPLHTACQNGYMGSRIAKLLLSAQANPNTMAAYLPRKKGGQRSERTALDFAITAASPEMIQILLEAGADFNTVRIHKGVTYDAIQVHLQHSQETAVALPTANSQTLSPNLQVLTSVTSSNNESKQVPALKLCLKKVEYAVKLMKRGERERLRWVCSE